MPLDAWFTLVLVVASAALVVIRPAWRVARFAVTAVHEFGHLVTAVALGGRAARVRLRADTSGLTTWRTAQTGRIRSGVIALAGPALPPLVGAGCAWAFATDRAAGGVLALAVGVALMSLVVRNLWGLVVCAALAALCWWAWRDDALAAPVLMVVTATVLCLGGLRAVAEELAGRSTERGGGADTSDTRVAADALWLPPVVWGSTLLVWALACTGWATWRIALAP